MNEGKASKVFWILVKCLLVCCFCLFWVRSVMWPFSKESPVVGKPLYNEKVHLTWGAISDYLICGDKLVLLYDDKRVVQFYNLNGEPLFSYTFAFQEKGRASLYTDRNDLIVEDYNRNYYLFSGEGVLLEYVTENKKKDEMIAGFLSSAEARSTEDGSIYKLSGASIYRINKGVTKKIISRPFFMSIFQGARTIILSLFFAILLLVRNVCEHSCSRNP